MSYDNWNGSGAQASGWYSGDIGGAQYNVNFDDVNSAYDTYGGNQAYNQYSAYNQGSPQQSDYYSGNMFMPSAQMSSPQNNAGYDDVDVENEPPLLEELGINFEHIRLKTMAVLNPLKVADAESITDQDLAGPLVFCMLFGIALLLHGKVHFGYIYGIGVLGCVGMYGLLNAMAPSGISATCTASVLGYCMLPMALLSLLRVVVAFSGIAALITSSMAVLWCSQSAAKLFVTALNMHHQQLLVAYPCALLYGLFALLAVF